MISYKKKRKFLESHHRYFFKSRGNQTTLRQTDKVDRDSLGIALPLLLLLLFAAVDFTALVCYNDIAAIGAILRFAVSDSWDFIDIPTVGTILIVAGVVGLIVGLALEFNGRRPDAAPPRDRF